MGLAAVGSSMTHGSGDYVIAFTNAEAARVPHADSSPTRSVIVLRDEALSPLFQAAIEATQEAVLNSLLRAATVTGFQGRTVEALPLDRLIEVCRRHHVLAN
jgi:D-aminopeptidase